jgi:hypothetical protein
MLGRTLPPSSARNFAFPHHKTWFVFWLVSLFWVSILRAEDVHRWHIQAQQTWAYDSNVFRLPQQAQGPSDHIQSTLAEWGITGSTGRQNMNLSAQWQQNRYQNLASLNYDGWRLGGKFHTSLPQRTALQLDASVAETMAPFNPGNAPLITERNLAHTEQWQGILEIGTATALKGELIGRHESLEYSSARYAPYNLIQNLTAVGISYQPRAALFMRGALSQRRYERPQAYPYLNELGAERYERNTLDLEGRWQPDDRFQWQWQATAGSIRNIKSRLNWQATSHMHWSFLAQAQESRQGLAESAINSAFNTRRSQQMEVQTQWNASAHWQWTLSASWLSRRIQESMNGTNLSISPIRDQTRLYQAGFVWKVTSSVQSNCQIQHTQRQVQNPILGIATYNYPFNSRGIFCGIGVTLPSNSAP